MHLLTLLLSIVLLATILRDAFETVILPRTVNRRFGLTRVYFGFTWTRWSRAAALFRAERRRERFLAVFGPLSLLGLAGVWALGLLIGFAGLHWSAGSNLRPLHATGRFIDDLYMSGTTFFTLGLGDLQPVGQVARLITVAEAGTGFAFLAIVIAYFPVFYPRQSWVSALAAILDLSALVETGIAGVPTWQAHVTFAMARHAAVDLTQVLHADPETATDRLSDSDLEEVRRQLESAGLRPARSAEADSQLLKLRLSYEPYINGLAKALMMPAPPWRLRDAVRDNWQVSPKGAGGAHL